MVSDNDAANHRPRRFEVYAPVFIACGHCAGVKGKPVHFSTIELKQLETDKPVQVVVRDNNVDQALRALKKKLQREGVFREMKLRNFYEKPSEKRAREKAEAVRRSRKLARKRAQREGLLPSKAPTTR